MTLGFPPVASQPNRSLDRFNLAEKGPWAAKLVMPPVLQEALSFRSDAPLVGTGKVPPGRHVTANLIDDRSGIVLLFFR